MLLGAVLLVDGPPELRIQWSTAIAVTAPFALITVFLLRLAIKARSNKSSMSDGGLMNQIGVARTALEPTGKVFIHGEYWDAESSAPVNIGGEVRVVAVEGFKLKVAPVTTAQPR
jgi:membrane-bound serine protease (ClpP class)